jgi:hypothetical protein
MQLSFLNNGNGFRTVSINILRFNVSTKRLLFLYFSKDKIKEDEMGSTSFTHRELEHWIQNFGPKGWREDITWKT